MIVDHVDHELSQHAVSLMCFMSICKFRGIKKLCGDDEDD